MEYDRNTFDADATLTLELLKGRAASTPDPALGLLLQTQIEAAFWEASAIRERGGSLAAAQAQFDEAVRAAAEADPAAAAEADTDDTDDPPEDEPRMTDVP